MFGTVTRYFNDKGYGFIRGQNKKVLFFHKSDLYGEYIAKGYCVFFTPNHNSKGDRAENITVVVADEEV